MGNMAIDNDVNKPVIAGVAILAAMAILGVIDNLVARIAGDIGLWQFHAMRSGLALGLLGIMAAGGLITLRARRVWAVALRGIMTALTMLIYFGCLAFLPVGQVASGLFSAPLWILLLGRIFLGHRPGRVQVLIALVGFGGVLMVLDPFGEGLRLVSLLPLVAGLFYAIAGLATRQWCSGESAAAMLAWFFAALGVFGLIGLVLNGLWAHDVPLGNDGFILRPWVAPAPWVLGVIAVQAVGSLLAVGLIMRAYQLGEASHVAVLEYSLIPIAAFWGWLLWGQVTGLREAVGIAVILASGLLSMRAARQ